MGRVWCHLSEKTWLGLVGGAVKTVAFLHMLVINMSFSHYTKEFFLLLECLQNCRVES